MLHLVWDLGWFSRTEFTVPRPNMNDGGWHKVEVDRVRQSLELRVDGEVFGSQGGTGPHPILTTRFAFCHFSQASQFYIAGLFIRSKVLCMFCFEICTHFRGPRGGKKEAGSANFKTKHAELRLEKYLEPVTLLPLLVNLCGVRESAIPP